VKINSGKKIMILTNKIYSISPITSKYMGKITNNMRALKEILLKTPKEMPKLQIIVPQTISHGLINSTCELI
jgi:hypothetical protein